MKVSYKDILYISKHHPRLTIDTYGVQLAVIDEGLQEILRMAGLEARRQKAFAEIMEAGCSFKERLENARTHYPDPKPGRRKKPVTMKKAKP